MTQPIALDAILHRLEAGTFTPEDLDLLKTWMTTENQRPIQSGKYVVNIAQVLGQVHIGDRTTLSDEQIQAIAQAIREQLLQPPETSELPAIDDLVQQVRSRIHDDIQRLHGTMPLWGVDHWVPLGELFVDVNILEEVSSNRRSELADLWQDFSQNPGYRSLDRMGLGKEQQRVSGLEVLDRNTNLMVVGKPGSGKTTYLQRVVTECNVGNLQAHRIPVLIRVREFVEDGRGVNYAVERYLERCWRLSKVEVQLVLDEGRSLVLLDGLDEVTGENGKAIVKQIKRFSRDYPQVIVIVTCRTQSQESRFERFDSVEVADFNEPQVRAFAEHWFQTVCGDLTVGRAKATAFLDQLFREENKTIRDLVITPILLSLTCSVFQQKQAFYSKRSKLYEEGLELLLEQWDKSREIERDEVYRDLSVERKLELLSYLAVKKFEQEQYVLFEQGEIEGYIGEFLGIGVRESRGVLRAIESQYGLLIERATNVWSFSHLTIQEFLVAQWFIQHQDFQKLTCHAYNEHWNEVILLFGSILSASDSNKFLRLLQHQINDLIKKDKWFQKLLTWAQDKVNSIKIIQYNPSAIRIFYVYFASLQFACIEDFLHPNRDILAYKIDPIFRQDVAGSYARNLTNRTSEFIFSRSNDIAIDIAFSLLFDNDLFLPWAIMTMQSVFTLELTPRFRLELQFLMNLLPSNLSFSNFSDWNQEKRNIWLKQMRHSMIKNRNIGQDMQFTEYREHLFEQYYLANKLLVNCLYSSSCSFEIRKQIEDTLFLPIAEIEKRNREKSE